MTTKTKVNQQKSFSYLNAYLLSRRAENCSPLTLGTYEKRVRYFLEFSKKPLEGIEKSDVELYLLHLRQKRGQNGKNLSPHYIESSYRALHGFFNWMVEDGILPESPMKNIKRPKTPKFAKGFLSQQEFQGLLAVCPPGDYRGIRNKAWLMLFWTTGARFSELANLKLNDLDWDAGRIRVVGKGAKERYVPLTKEARKAVYRYLCVRPETYPELWITEERRPMSRDGLVMATRRIYQRAGIKVKDVHHIFRRTWAYRNLKAGVPLKFVQLIGGWESLGVLEQYVKMMDSEDALDGVRWC